MARVTESMNSGVQSISDGSAATLILANDTYEQCEALSTNLDSQSSLVKQFRGL